MDYLEANYTPGIITGENLVCYGRKIRFDYEVIKDSASKSLTGEIKYIAWYCEMDGGRPSEDDRSETRWVPIGQLCDAQSLLSTNPYIRHLPNTNTEGFSDEEEIQSLIDQLSSDSSPESIDELKDVTVGSINPTIEFPSTQIDRMDSDTVDPDNGNSMPLLYAMTVWSSPSSSGLVSWMTSNSETNSLYWWANWLDDHGYSYGNALNSDALSNYLKDNYTYALAEQGIIVLNLDTISKINEEFDREEKASLISNIRTYFKILGFLLILYSSVLLACWVFDINLDVGLNLLEKASFHRLVAVISMDELEPDPDAPYRFVAFKEIMVQTVLLIAIGGLLIFVDIIKIVTVLIDTLGVFVTQVYNTISH